MNLFFLENIDNFLGRHFIEYFSNKKDNKLFILDKYIFNSENKFIENDIKILENYLNIEKFLSEENIFVFNTNFINEYENFNEKYIDELISDLNSKFEMVKFICRKLIENKQKATFYFFSINTTLHNAIDFPIAPIRDESIFSFIKSISKEMTSFDIFFNGVCIDPIFEMLTKDQIRNYRRNMSLYSLRKNPTKIQDLLKFIENLFLNRTKLSSGSIYNIGDGMFF